MTTPTVTIERSDRGAVVSLAGSLLVGGVDAVLDQLRAVGGPGEVVVDLEGLDGFDTAGAWAILELKRRLAAEGADFRIEGASDARRTLLETVESSLPGEPPPPAAGGRDRRLGRRASARPRSAPGGSRSSSPGFLGAIVAAIAGLVVRPWRLRLTSLVFHMQEAGLNAVPIVALMAFLIGMVLAFQGATQLRQFGAEVFVVDLIAISMLRELGILLTAIIVAGRSASAFTAAIGSMKMREEIDAMRTLGLDPVEVLVVPRVLALILTLPLLGFIADMAGLIGGAAMSWIELGVSPGMFRARLQERHRRLAVRRSASSRRRSSR